LKEVLQKYSEIRLGLREIRRFRSDKHHVLHLRVVSDDLRRLNRELRERFPITTTYPDYQPHLTLAYVQPGTHLRLDGSRAFQDTAVTADRLVYSAPGVYAQYYTDSERLVLDGGA
jgi:2'-5' RNA ligase